MRNKNPWADVDAAERAFHNDVKGFGFKGVVHRPDGAAFVFSVQIPRKCERVFESSDRAEAVKWAEANRRK